MKTKTRYWFGNGAWGWTFLFIASLVPPFLRLPWDVAACGPAAWAQEESPDIIFAAGSGKMAFDPEIGVKVPGPIEAVRGSVERPGLFQVGLYYRSRPGDLDPGDPDMPQTDDHIQGLSMAIKFDTKCITCEGTFDVTGTITEAVNAEYVNVLCENNVTEDVLAPGRNCPDDGDKGELIVGILVDALPPFDGQDLPPIEDFLELLSVDFHVNPSGEWDCDRCTNTALHFPVPEVTPDPFDGGRDGADVFDLKTCKAGPLIRNLASVRVRVPDPSNPGEYITEQRSLKPGLLDGTVKIVKYLGFTDKFRRGDASRSGKIDLSDAVVILNYLFLGSATIYCQDAADLDDNGLLEISDAIRNLSFQFLGAPWSEPAPPGAYRCGADETADDLAPCEYMELYCQ